MSTSTEDWYARQADRIARGPQLYGGNAALLELRCWKFYHPDSGSFVTDPGGRDRWLGPKASRVYAILHRTAGSGERLTMTQVASEALCCTSTVSRVVTRLQAWGMLAVDVTRGRNGGMLVRLPAVVPAMRHYIDAAWRRIRSWINVASRSLFDGTTSEVSMTSTSTSKDATFTREAALERLGARVLAGEIGIDTLSALNGRDRRLAEEEARAHERYAAWAMEVVLARRDMDYFDPDLG